MLDVYPIFKPNFSVNIVPNDGVFLISENQSLAFQGALIEQVAALMNGQTSVRDITFALHPTFSHHDVIAVIERMWGQGVLLDHRFQMGPATSFWCELGIELAELFDKISALPIEIVSSNKRWLEPATNALEELGLQVQGRGQLLIAIVDDYLDPQLFAIDHYCQSNGILWMPFKPSGTNIWLGPIFIPQQTACWSCLHTRLLSNRQAENYILQATGQLPQGISSGGTSASLAQSMNMLATSTARFVATGESPLVNALTVMRTIDTELSYHAVQRLPQCSVCGDPRLAAIHTTEFTLADVAKHPGVDDGGERLQTPEKTIRQYEHLVSPLTGVVKELIPNRWNEFGPIYSYTAGHNFALNDHWQSLQTHLRSNSGGKGRTEVQAKTGALCEALERYSGRYQGCEVRINSTLRALGDQGIHPNRCQLFSDAQYHDRDQWLARQGHFTDVPVAFDETQPVEWSPVYSHSHRTVRYLPTGYLFYGYPQHHQNAAFWADSNGAASGTSLTDAVLQGFYEVVERDAVGIWWYNQIARPQVDLATLDDPYLQEVRDFYRQRNRHIWILDLTTDVGIPVFAALSKRIDRSVEDIIFGFGAHLNARIALHRAVAELNQFAPSVLDADPAGNTIYSYEDPEARRFWQTTTTATQPWLAPLPGKSLSIDDFPDVSKISLLDQVEHGFGRMSALGMEVLLLNQTRPDVALPVARVLVPGMRHFWARYAPGRLYDVPVKMGWLQSPTPESQLNPISVFF